MQTADVAINQANIFELIAAESLIDPVKLVPEATLESLGVDSVDVVSFMFALEEKYGIRLEDDEISKDQSLGSLVALILSKSKALTH